MALDGIVTSCLRKEIEECLINGRISKIAQPEADELLLTVKSQKGQYRLLLSASASLPFACLVDSNMTSPASAPNFCMLLRKHIGGGRIVSVEQPGLERILILTVEHLDELGDLRHMKLILEMMGKHSNLIFCDENDVIIDSIKHIPASVSSYREVLPGRPYFIPNTRDKSDPLTLTWEEFCSVTVPYPGGAVKALYSTLTGLSPAAAAEICWRAGVDQDQLLTELGEDAKFHLYRTLDNLMQDIREERFIPNVICRDGRPEEFSAVPLTHLAPAEQYYGAADSDPSQESKGTDSCRYTVWKYDSMSQVIQDFYSRRSAANHIRQKSTDLRRVVSTALERNVKKYNLQQKQLADTADRDTWRKYGELIHAYGYGLPEKSTSLTVPDYSCEGKEITIPLDPDMSPGENAARYFEKYNKKKRTYEALTGQIAQTEADINHLESISASLDTAQTEGDLSQIRDELVQYGYIKKKDRSAQGNTRGNSGGRAAGKAQKKEKHASGRPLHYINEDGFNIYVGKNNFQNEEVTFRIADGGDWWFHAKGRPGSHVIVKTEGRELTDRTFLEAAACAAYYSKQNDDSKVEVDYVRRKEVRKAAGGRPGFVIYHTNYSMVTAPSLDGLKEIQ